MSTFAVFGIAGLVALILAMASKVGGQFVVEIPDRFRWLLGIIGAILLVTGVVGAIIESNDNNGAPTPPATASASEEATVTFTPTSPPGITPPPEPPMLESPTATGASSIDDGTITSTASNTQTQTNTPTPAATLPVETNEWLPDTAVVSNNIICSPYTTGSNYSFEAQVLFDTEPADGVVELPTLIHIGYINDNHTNNFVIWGSDVLDWGYCDNGCERTARAFLRNNPDFSETHLHTDGPVTIRLEVAGQFIQTFYNDIHISELDHETPVSTDGKICFSRNDGTPVTISDIFFEQSSSPPSSTPIPTTAPETYALSVASPNCEAIYRTYPDEIAGYEGHERVFDLYANTYLINDIEGGLEWISGLEQAAVYGLLVCHFELPSNVSTAEISFTEGQFAFEPTACPTSSLMQIYVYQGLRTIEDGQNPVLDNPLIFPDSPLENYLGYWPVNCNNENSAGNTHHFNIPGQPELTIVVAFADGWTGRAVTVRVSDLQLRTLPDTSAPTNTPTATPVPEPSPSFYVGFDSQEEWDALMRNPGDGLHGESYISESQLVSITEHPDVSRALASRASIPNWTRPDCFVVSTTATLVSLNGVDDGLTGIMLELWIGRNRYYFVFRTEGGPGIRYEPSGMPIISNWGFYPEHMNNGFEVNVPYEIEIVYDNNDVTVLINGSPTSYLQDWVDFYNEERADLLDITRFGLGAYNTGTGPVTVEAEFDYFRIDSCE